MHPVILQELAAERVKDMIARADDARRASQARQARRAGASDPLARDQHNPAGQRRAKVRWRYQRRIWLRSTDRPLEGAMLRCPAGHGPTGPSNPSPWGTTDNHNPGTAADAAPATAAPTGIAR